MEAAKLAVLQKPRPLAQSFFVLALDGVVHAGERVLLEAHEQKFSLREGGFYLHKLDECVVKDAVASNDKVKEGEC